MAGRFAAALAAAGVIASAAHAELTYQEILEALPGTWEIDPAEADEARRGARRCDANPVVIRFVEDDDRGLVYESTRPGEEGSTLRAPVRPRPFAILIQYDDEARRTPSGELVEWYLVMPDRDHFYWVRADNPGGRTFMRRRCPAGPIA